MSEFSVKLTKIATVRNHSNADRLDVASVEGSTYQFVTGRDQVKVGDDVIYFPIDSVIPQILIAKMGLTGKLAGKDMDRVKTVKLRGEISQGLIAKPEEILPGTDAINHETLTAFLGVTKHVPPEKPCQNGTLVPLPQGQSMYDIENAENHAAVLASLMDMDIVVTEKVEGSNFSVTVEEDGKVFVNQRCNAIEPVDGPEHDYWKIAKAQGLIDAARSIHSAEGNKRVVIYGEYLGPGMMGNIYGFVKNRVACFDIMVDYRFVGWGKVLEIRKATPIEWVPVVFVGKLRDFITQEGKGFPEISDGDSHYCRLAGCKHTLREGLVVKPVEEFTIDCFGRAIIKQRSPKYLAKEE